MVHRGFMGKVTHKTKRECPAGIAGGSCLVAGPALSIQTANLGYQHSRVCSRGHGDGAHRTPQHGFGEPWQVGEQLQELLQKSLKQRCCPNSWATGKPGTHVDAGGDGYSHAAEAIPRVCYPSHEQPPCNGTRVRFWFLFILFSKTGIASHSSISLGSSCHSSTLKARSQTWPQRPSPGLTALTTSFCQTRGTSMPLPWETEGTPTAFPHPLKSRVRLSLGTPGRQICVSAKCVLICRVEL